MERGSRGYECARFLDLRTALVVALLMQACRLDVRGEGETKEDRRFSFRWGIGGVPFFLIPHPAKGPEDGPNSCLFARCRCITIRRSSARFVIKS